MTDIDHRQIIASLSADERRLLTTKANAPGLLRLGIQVGLVIVFGAMIAIRVPYWPVLMLPQGILIVFLFTTLHETTHETAFESPWLNSVVAAASGFLVLVPPLWFRYFHFAHHRHTHDPQNDPELSSPKPRTLAQYLAHLSGVPFWIAMARVIVTNAADRNRDAFIPAKGAGKIVREARIFLAVYALLIGLSLLAASPLLFWVWIVPLILGQPFLRAYLLAEHTGCPHVASMLENTRTTFTTSVVRFIAWNMPYHSEHHSYPAVPFHRLPRLHRMIAENLRSTERGYVRFHRKLVDDLNGEAGSSPTSSPG